jgi:Ca-activated chloride channel homolog
MYTYNPKGMLTISGEPLMLKGVRVEGDLRGLMFESTVEQRFVNENDSNVELFYAFPLPWGAVLLGVDVTLGEKRLTGSVVAKKQAEEQYEEALSEGDAAIMLERLGDGSYGLNLGNLIAGEACVITLRYAQTLQFEQGGVRLLIPTVIAPRYGNPLTEGGLQPHQVSAHDPLVEYPFDITLRLHGELAGARVASPSHPVAVAHQGGDKGKILTVSLARRGALDRDFVLVADQLAHTSLLALGRDMVRRDLVVALASFFPRIKKALGSALAVKLLVDCSGSMAGDSIDAARRALQAVVGQFADGDRFSLSRFGSSVENRSRALWRVTGPTRLAAQRWVDGLDADLGGTEMEAALESVFALGHAGDSDVLMVTDGEVYAIDAIIERACASGHRIFVVGIGSSPAESNLRRIAETTGGACDFVAPGEAVEPAVLRMFARLRSPCMMDLRLQWPEGVVPVWESPIPKSVFDSDTLNIFAQLSAVPCGELRLMARRSTDAPLEEIANASLQGDVIDDDALGRMAASVRIGARLMETADSDEIDTGVLEEAVAYQLVTGGTNFLMVHRRAADEKATDMPTMYQVPQMLAAGWGGTSSLLKSSAPLYQDLSADLSMSAGEDLASFSISRSASFGADESLSMRSAISDAYEIPAFLRSSRSEERLRERAVIDRADPNHWSDQGHYAGLTPLGLAIWLNGTERKAWPQDFAGLRKCGLGDQVVDWLDLVVGQGAGMDVAEAELVVAFLCFMASSDTVEMLRKSARGNAGSGQSKGMLKALADWLSELGGTRVSDALVERLHKGLAGMQADTWPDCVFAMEMVGSHE